MTRRLTEFSHGAFWKDPDVMGDEAWTFYNSERNRPPFDPMSRRARVTQPWPRTKTAPIIGTLAMASLA